MVQHICDEDDEEQKKNVNYISCDFNVRGTSFITRQSKYRMEYTFPNESSSN